MAAPQYNIREMVAAHDRPAKLLFALWEILAPCSAELTEEEQIILDAWNFDSTYGNRICDLLANENYDVIAAGLKAMRSLNQPRLREFSESVESVFSQHGISCNTGDEIAKLERLPSEERKQLGKELEASEAPFLNDIWNEGLVHTAVRNFIEANLNRLSQRNTAES